jgi:nucleotide-binding universal stress UspA family protein
MTAVAKIARVLVGVDFDPASSAALQMAAQLSRAWNAELTVLHSAPDDVPAYFFTPKQIDELETEQQRSRAAKADEVRVFAGPLGTGAQVVIESGPPREAILRIAPQFDLIALGTHRRHGTRAMVAWISGGIGRA